MFQMGKLYLFRSPVLTLVFLLSSKGSQQPWLFDPGIPDMSVGPRLVPLDIGLAVRLKILGDS